MRTTTSRDVGAETSEQFEKDKSLSSQICWAMLKPLLTAECRCRLLGRFLFALGCLARKLYKKVTPWDFFKVLISLSMIDSLELQEIVNLSAHWFTERKSLSSLIYWATLKLLHTAECRYCLLGRFLFALGSLVRKLHKKVTTWDFFKGLVNLSLTDSWELKEITDLSVCQCLQLC